VFHLGFPLSFPRLPHSVADYLGQVFAISPLEKFAHLFFCALLDLEGMARTAHLQVDRGLFGHQSSLSEAIVADVTVTEGKHYTIEDVCLAAAPTAAGMGGQVLMLFYRLNRWDDR